MKRENDKKIPYHFFSPAYKVYKSIKFYFRLNTVLPNTGD